MKIGVCYYRDDNGFLYMAESFIDENGVVTTVNTLVNEPVPTE
jgi:hypothetical protein